MTMTFVTTHVTLEGTNFTPIEERQKTHGIGQRGRRIRCTDTVCAGQEELHRKLIKTKSGAGVNTSVYGNANKAKRGSGVVSVYVERTDVRATKMQPIKVSNF